MAVEKIIKLITELDDEGLEQLESGLKKVQVQQKKVEVQSKKTGTTTKDSLRGSQAAADRLGGGLSGVAEQFVVVGKAAKKGGLAIKSALISTGVGALIVALGVIIDNWESISEAIGLTNKDIERQNELLSIQAGVADANLDYLKEKLKIQKNQGASDEAIAKIEDEISKRRIKRQEQLNEQIENQQKLVEKLRKEGDPENTEDIKAANDAYIQLLNLRRERLRLNDEIFQSEAVIIEASKKTDDKSKKEKREKEEDLEIITPEDEQKFLTDLSNLLAKGRETGLEVLQNQATQELQNWQNTEEAKTAISAYEEEERRKLIERGTELAKQYADAERDYKVGVAMTTLNALSSLAEQGSAGAKAIAITQAVISTYQGINKALAETTDFTPSQTLRFANAAAVGLAGFANVANILKSNPSGSARPNISGVGGGGGVSAPSFNVVGTSGVNQLAESLQQDQQPIEAYVVANNVTTAQSLNNNIVETASIG